MSKSHQIMDPEMDQKMDQKGPKHLNRSFWAILGQKWFDAEKGTKSPILGGFGLFDH